MELKHQIMNKLVEILEPDAFLEEVKATVRDEIAKSMTAKNDPLRSRIETAAYLGISKTTLDNWVKTDKIKRSVLGGKIYFRQSAIDNALS